MAHNHTASWVALAEALGPRSAHLLPLLARFGTPDAIFAADEAQILEACPTVKPSVLRLLCSTPPHGRAVEIIKYCTRHGVKILCLDDTAYPAPLKAIAAPPAVLYVLGKLPSFGVTPAVGVVGARHLDAYGARMAYKLSFEMGAAGAAIVSGLAEGIDGIAAAAALEAGALTVAVLGAGIDRVYPKCHKRLFSEVAEFGAIVTEFSPGTPPNAWHFPMRNRIISALCDALVVVQAGENSGSLITARYALLQGKALFAVPGNADSPLSVGTNRLLRAGALLCTCTEDVLSHFHFLYPALKLAVLPAETCQYSALLPEVLRAHGIAAPSTEGEAKSENKRRSRKESTAPEAVSAPEEAEAADETDAAQVPPEVLAEALNSLSAEERALYDRLPDGLFTVDVLVSAGASVAAAVGAMTLFEILGLVRTGVGGTYVKL